MGKTKCYTCYKHSHICLDLIWKLKFESLKCQPGKSSRSTHRPGPRRKAYFQIWKDSWLDGEEKICTDCQDRIVCNFVCWFGLWKNTSYTVFDQDSAFKKI